MILYHISYMKVTIRTEIHTNPNAAAHLNTSDFCPRLLCLLNCDKVSLWLVTSQNIFWRTRPFWVVQVVEPVQSSTMARHSCDIHHGLSHRKGPSPHILTSFQCSSLDLGGASEVDEEEHCEVQPALLLHVHEDRQLQGEEEVPWPPGIFALHLQSNLFSIFSTLLMPAWWGMMSWKCFKTLTPRFFWSWLLTQSLQIKNANSG